MIEDDAPTSPRSSAIYYWGGDLRTSNEYHRHQGHDCIRYRSRSRFDDEERSNVPHSRRRHRDDRTTTTSDTTVKFVLSLDDEGDDGHWMLLRASSSSSSSSSSSTTIATPASSHSAHPPPSSSPPPRPSSTSTSTSFADEEGAWGRLSSGPLVLPDGTVSSPPSPSSSSSSSVIVGGNDRPPPSLAYPERTTSAMGNGGRVDEYQYDDAPPPSNIIDFASIPIVDLSLPDDACAIRVGEACRRVGFFYVVNHGVDPNVTTGIMNVTREFFRRDSGWKIRSTSSASDGGVGGYRGYFDVGSEDLEYRDGTRDLSAEEGGRGGTESPSSSSYSSNDNDDDGDDGDNDCDSTGGYDGRKRQRRGGDFKEGFDCGLEVDVDVGSGDARVEFFGRNLWPDETANPSIFGFRETLLRYQSELLRLSDKLLLALGRSLNHRDDDPMDRKDGGGRSRAVAEDYFVSRSRNPMCTLRLLHYPPGGHASKSPGCGAHTDYGLFTILLQDSAGGLQVRNRGGDWIDARPMEDSFVINVGDMLSLWTDGEYASTVHRVISPGGGGDRYSVPFFFNPDSDAVVKPLRRRAERRRLDEGEESADDDVDANEQGRTALEILKDRYNGTFKKN
ncbi:hypothetical protein ACHAXA_003623 [Cyclostephanos tholiformis]|uniref:Fe2OG dioxygenase domain-containing protein n=1 Tax=Cyclostephanos tholiformis TaxID=382380 RepID=A0ABD3SPQ3_9STRA